MADLTTLTSQLSGMKTRMYNRLVAQGDTTIQANDSMETYTSHYESLYRRQSDVLTVTENGTYTATTSPISGYSNIVVNVPSGGGNHTRYKLFDRVYADSTGDSIGTVCGFYKGSNSVEYAVVCLDATYRLAQGQWAASTGAIPNMPLYGTWNLNINGTETATQNGDLILASKASTAVSHCRSKSFSIGGTTYYGQLPNICELLMILGTHTILYNMDPTVSSAATNLNFVQNGFPSNAWSSSQSSAYAGWCISSFGIMDPNSSKTTNSLVFPILEIPNVL